VKYKQIYYKYLDKKNLLDILILLIFVSYFFVGVIIFNDYGISWDEEQNRYMGFISLNYIREIFNLSKYEGFEYTDQIFAESIKHYGVLFDLPMAFIEKAFNINDTKNYFLLRHFFNFFIFYISSIFFYFLLRIRFSKILSIAGLLFWILSPRIFADSFYNMKDIVFLSFFTIGIFFAIKFINEPTIKYALLSSFTSALAIDIRIVGIIIPFIIIFFFIMMLLENKNQLRIKLPKITLYIISLIVFTIIFWPFLWENPLENFLTAIEKMSSYPMRLSVFYFGEYISSVNLPWHYSLTWIFITTPIIYLILFIIGSLLIVFQLFKRFLELSNNEGSRDPWKSNNERMDIILFIIFYFTLFLIIEMNSTLYGGWRHLFFIYPSLIYMSIRGLEHICNYFSFKYIFIILLPFLIFTSHWMVKNHPHQFVYFNKFAGKDVAKNFELDYWGTSNISSLKYIINFEKNNELKIYIGSVSPYNFSLSLLNEDEKKRIKFTENLEDANFLVTNHYYQKGNPITINKSLMEKFDLLKEFKVDNMVINSVYRIK